MDARTLALVLLAALAGGRHPAGLSPAPLTEAEVRSWREELEPLFDKGYGEALARLGLPADQGPGGRMIYAETATRRSLSVDFSHGVIDAIQVKPRDGEDLPVREVVERPETYYRCYGRSESASDYMAAWSRDGKVMLQFRIEGRRMRLYRVMLYNDALAKAAVGGPPPCRGTPEDPEVRSLMSRPNPPYNPPPEPTEDEPVRVEAEGEGVLTYLRARGEDGMLRSGEAGAIVRPWTA